MLGTLNGALEVRQVSLPPDAMRATVEGINEIIDRVPVLIELEIHYELRIPADAREVVDRALETHQSKCPSARTIADCVRVSWTADITET